MPYCTTSDLLARIGEAELIELTDDDSAGVLDAARVSAAIADADAEIDSYCGSRYTSPFSPVPVMIKKLSVDMAVYNLFSRRAHLAEVPKARKDRYDNAIRFLRDVAKGVVSLGADAPAEAAADLPETTRAADDRIFSIGKASAGRTGSLDNY
ncbi:MAG TPA: DUF1320 domain-containing protein [Acidobacteriota bacterium]|nr:DUF1320 domain-containing protein [Acidobacteriota bacterium]